MNITGKAEIPETTERVNDSSCCVCALSMISLLPNNQLPPLLYRPECRPESDRNFVTELAGSGGEVLAGPRLNCGRRRCGRFPKNTGQHCGRRNRGTASTPPFGRTVPVPVSQRISRIARVCERYGCFSTPTGSRTPVFELRTRRPGPLDDGGNGI